MARNLRQTLAVGPSSGDAPVQEVTFSGSVTVQLDLRTGTNLQFVTRASSPEAIFIDELATDVWLLGDFLNLRLRAWAVWQEWFTNGQDNVHVMAVSYKKLLARRLVHGAPGLSFVDADLGDILWGMWEHTQSQPGGNLGVTPGARTTGMLRTRTYKQGESLGQLAEKEYDQGMWWAIDDQLVFTAGAEADLPWLAIPLHLAANVRTMQRAAGADFANSVFGDADDAVTTGVWVDAPDVATDPRGRWERAVGWPTVQLQSTLDSYTAAALSVHYAAPAHWNVEIEGSRWLTDTRLMPGMFAVLVVPRTLAAPVGPPADTVIVFCTQLSVNFDEDGALNVKAVVEERPYITAPLIGV
jgi:hypothetical protein